MLWLCAALVVIATIVALLVVSFWPHREGFCEYTANAGYVCPTEEVWGEDYVIRPYQKCSRAVKDSLESHLQTEWKLSAAEMVTELGAGADAFYVMTSLDGAQLLGSVSVDRLLGYARIANLYVVPEQRSRGRARTLLSAAEQYSRQLGYTTVRAHVEPHMEGFYTNLGWERESWHQTD